MHGCDAGLSLLVTILKIVLAGLEMTEARRKNGEPPQQS
jgi:hypothetical protein